MDKLGFLKRAESYAAARDDDMYFKNLYTGFRKYNNVDDSVWKTLSYLYDADTAQLLKYKYCETVL